MVTGVSYQINMHSYNNHKVANISVQIVPFLLVYILCVNYFTIQLILYWLSVTGFTITVPNRTLILVIQELQI